ncbi:MAG: hypothetical protein LW750_07145 [Bacteroidetes bacterium]|nr:hypothetical protein [Bacteroidota bacterium]
MKKIILTCCLITSSFSAWSQRGEGGTPYSNKYDYFNNEVPFVTMQLFNIDSVRNAAAFQDSVKGPYKFGYNYFTNLNPDNSGYWKDLSNGERMVSAVFSHIWMILVEVLATQEIVTTTHLVRVLQHGQIK